MGCCASKNTNTADADVVITEPKPVTNAASPETKISTSNAQVALPTGPDITQFESSSGRGGGWAETMAVRTSAGSRPRHRSTSRSRPHTVVGSSSPAEIPQVPPLPPSARGSSSAQLTEAPRSQSSARAPRGSATAQPDKPSSVKQSGKPSLRIDELKGLSPASVNVSERVKALDLTSKLTEKTKPKFTGGFSDVLQAKLGNRVVAVKVLRAANIEGSEDQRWKRLARELYVWVALDHENVLELLGYAFEDGKPCLISPWCDNGTLQDYLQKFPNPNRRKLVREIAEGLRYLHEQTPPVIHGDLKTTNVFVTDGHIAKISDFGGSKRADQLKTGFTTAGLVLTTIRYSAPEILRDGQQPSLSSDVFSFACVALETMTDKPPFWKIPNVVAVITQVVFQKKMPSPEDHPGMEDAIWELLRRCWSYEPSGRPGMMEVCQKLSKAGYGSSTGFYPPARAGPSHPRPKQPQRAAATTAY